jgi:hypothetical protein
MAVRQNEKTVINYATDPNEWVLSIPQPGPERNTLHTPNSVFIQYTAHDGQTLHSPLL